MKQIVSLLWIAILSVTLGVSSALASTENYVAIGDSLAAGQTPNQEIDAGYTDFIALRLGMLGKLNTYTKQLAFPGFTTADVLERVQSEEASELLKNATLITISAGANDLLRLVQVNPKAGTLAFSQLQVDYALNVARKNMAEILAELQVRAPNADVYVMGYYFAYPTVHATQKVGTNEQLIRLNTILQQQANGAGAKYVDVYEAFGLEGVEFLPNPADVHPNFEGYRQMANAFLKTYSGSNRFAIRSAELPKPNPKTFKEILDMQRTSEVDAGEIAVIQDEHAVLKNINQFVAIIEYRKEILTNRFSFFT